MMFYRGQRYLNPIPVSPYFFRGMEGGYNQGEYHHHDGYNPPPLNDGGGNEGGFFGGGALTSFIFGGIAGAVLANVFDQKQVNAQAAPYPAQPIPVATPFPYFSPYPSQPSQSPVINQNIAPQGYSQSITQPYGGANTQFIASHQPMGIQPFPGIITTPVSTSSLPVSAQSTTTVMPYYMVPIQRYPGD